MKRSDVKDAYGAMARKYELPSGAVIRVRVEQYSKAFPRLSVSLVPDHSLTDRPLTTADYEAAAEVSRWVDAWNANELDEIPETLTIDGGDDG
jgi:hypothetical protein